MFPLADIVIVPSVWEEPCGTTILEALRLGKVCYALERGGTPELVVYGAPGQLRLFSDIAALVDGLVDALTADHPDRSEKVSVPVMTGGRSADVTVATRRLLDLYAQIANAAQQA